ncbi:hypothetical protein [Candidatus Poriferisocius sp.]|uniref:hypothetical protein n=1 Tax=Candidatus Poriferisocius sp. TaxID=3101276 RepID=UPI003B02DFDD
MFDQPLARPALALAPDYRPELPASRRLPAKVYWFRRALTVSALFLVLWASSLLAAKLHWSLSPEVPAAGLSQSEPAYVIVGDTALPVSSRGR